MGMATTIKKFAIIFFSIFVIVLTLTYFISNTESENFILKMLFNLKGYLKILGVSGIMAIAIFIIQYLIGRSLEKQKVWTKKLDKKNDLIIEGNIDVLNAQKQTNKIQTEYLTKITEVHDLINTTKTDNFELKESNLKVNTTLERIERGNNRKLGKINKSIDWMKSKIVDHEEKINVLRQEIEQLKANQK